MAELTAEHVFNAPFPQVAQAIRSFEKFPKYLPGVTAVQVLAPGKAGTSARVRFEMKLVKTFFYTIHVYDDGPTRLRWELAESNFLKKVIGSWDLVDLGPGKTKGVYTLDVGFPALVPQMVVDQVTKANLPLLFRGYESLARDLAPSA